MSDIKPGDRVFISEYNRTGILKHIATLFENYEQAAVILDKPIKIGSTSLKKIYVPADWIQPLDIKIIWEV